MTSIDMLEAFFEDFEISHECSDELLDRLFEQFESDFINDPFHVRGMEVKIVDKDSRVEDFEGYPETFVHLITRKSNGGKRVYDPHRAQRLHWIKPILLQDDHEDIRYFEYEEDDGRIRDYYWYEEGDFLVIMEEVKPDYLVITSFHIDGPDSRRRYEKRYRNYRKRIKK